MDDIIKESPNIFPPKQNINPSNELPMPSEPLLPAHTDGGVLDSDIQKTAEDLSSNPEHHNQAKVSDHYRVISQQSVSTKDNSELVNKENAEFSNEQNRRLYNSDHILETSTGHLREFSLSENAIRIALASITKDSWNKIYLPPINDQHTLENINSNGLDEVKEMGQEITEKIEEKVMHNLENSDSNDDSFSSLNNSENNNLVKNEEVKINQDTAKQVEESIAAQTVESELAKQLDWRENEKVILPQNLSSDNVIKDDSKSDLNLNLNNEYIDEKVSTLPDEINPNQNAENDEMQSVPAPRLGEVIDNLSQKINSQNVNVQTQNDPDLTIDNSETKIISESPDINSKVDDNIIHDEVSKTTPENISLNSNLESPINSSNIKEENNVTNLSEESANQNDSKPNTTNLNNSSINPDKDQLNTEAVQKQLVELEKLKQDAANELQKTNIPLNNNNLTNNQPQSNQSSTSENDIMSGSKNNLPEQPKNVPIPDTRPQKRSWRSFLFGTNE